MYIMRMIIVIAFIFKGVVNWKILIPSLSTQHYAEGGGGGSVHKTVFGQIR